MLTMKQSTGFVSDIVTDTIAIVAIFTLYCNMALLEFLCFIGVRRKRSLLIQELMTERRWTEDDWKRLT